MALGACDTVADRRRMVAALTAPDLQDIVDLVLWTEAGDDGEVVAMAANALGTVRLRREGHHHVVSGVDPMPSEDPMAFLPYHLEVEAPSPATSLDNAYPYAAERILSFFADPDRSPDLAVVHSPRHYFPSEGGHRGEHGSLDVIQSRAPLILSGAGIRPLGRVDGHARLVDVAPTLAWLAGVPARDLRDAFGEPLDGRVLTEYLADSAHLADPVESAGQAALGGPVVGLLWDGAHCGDVLHLAETGELPHLAALIERGTALRAGAVAQFPSVTLTNHTSILTGVGPGRHGVLGNVFFDRERSERVVPNDASTWHRSAEWLKPGVRTVFEMVNEASGSHSLPRTASVDEAVDRGADYSTMQRVRLAGGVSGAAGLDDLLPDVSASAHVGSAEHLADRYFAWASRVDDAGLEQVLELFAPGRTPPALTWWASVVTDAGHHAGGPRSRIARDSLRDSDARLGTFLRRLGDLGVADQVTFLMTADHGFEGADLSCTGSWRPALDALGIPYRDEGPGFVYLLG